MVTIHRFKHTNLTMPVNYKTMEHLRKTLLRELINLEVEEEEVLTVSLEPKKFKKKALKVHSHKTLNSDDEEFKRLLNDYNKVKDALNEITYEVNQDNFFEKEETNCERIIPELD